MTDQYFLEFSPFDNPMHLKKVGNWVFTFCNSETKNTKLAITNIIPRHCNKTLEVRQIIIEQTEHDNLWKIQQIECFDGIQNRGSIFFKFDNELINIIQNILDDFKKYDVEIIFLDSLPK